MDTAAAMDVSTAYAVLGMKPESSLDEAKKAFEVRANRHDPDRVNSSLRQLAEAKMAEIDKAWDVVRRHLESGGGPVTYETTSLPKPIRRPIASRPSSVQNLTSSPAGWHPQADGQQRYWDGHQWTEHFAPGAPLVPLARRSGRFRFDGGAGTYLGTAILAALITIFTLGICYPFAVVLFERWRAEHTYIDGQRLVFTGTGLGLFGLWIKWFLLIIITVGIYSFWVAPRMQQWKVENTDFDGAGAYRPGMKLLGP